MKTVANVAEPFERARSAEFSHAPAPTAIAAGCPEEDRMPSRILAVVPTDPITQQPDRLRTGNGLDSADQETTRRGTRPEQEKESSMSGCEQRPPLETVEAAACDESSAAAAALIDSSDVLALCELWLRLDFPDERGTIAALRDRVAGGRR
jgi:hypothetical protein